MQVQLTDNARKIFDLRYSLKDADGNPTETPDKAIVRVSEAVAAAGGKYDPVAAKKLAKRYRTELLTPLKFVPNSPTWTGAGTGLGQLAACFVLPIADDLGRGRDSIFETMKVAALIQQTGGGNGFDFSDLRPKGALIKKSMGKSSGPVSFLKVYDSAFSSVQQGGTRRGANMAILRVDHPDIEEFIDAKLVEGEIANFNISVAVTDYFMMTLAHFPESAEFELVHDGKVYGTITPQRLWDKLVEGAWTLGDPGVFFVDRANAQNPCPSHYTLAATNPCGEQALPPYSNCCLGAIAVNRFVRWDGGKAKFDWQEFQDTIDLSVRFLDDVVDANKYLDDVPELAEAAMNERRIGLGIMGLADLLFDMGLPYDSPEGLAFVDQLMEYLRYHAMQSSIDRSYERGPFKWFEGSVYDLNHGGSWKPPSSVMSALGYEAWTDSDFGRPPVNWDNVIRGLKAHGIRNACQTTVAPTGTTSNFAGLEGSGIEPAFALSYVRKVMQEEENIDLHYLSQAFSAAVELPDGYSNDEVAELVAKNGGSCQGIGIVDEGTRSVFKVAGDIAPIDHVRMQAVCQAWIDNAISKTINMPFESTVRDVSDIYKLAWELGCKGITVYRQGSRQLEVLSTKKEEIALSLTMGQTIQEDRWPVLHPIPMPDYVSSTWHPPHDHGDNWRGRHGIPGRVFEVPTPFGNMQVTITELRSHPGRPFDVRLQIGKAGNDKHADVEAIGRMASISLRTGVDVRDVVDQLIGIGGRTSTGFGPSKIKSVADGLGKLLSNLYLTPLENVVRQPSVVEDPNEEVDLDWNPHSICPECKSATVVNDGGCSHCEVRLGGCGNFTACD